MLLTGYLGIGTYVYYRRRPFDLGRFDKFVARQWPKGICYFQDEQQTCYVFEQASTLTRS